MSKPEKYLSIGWAIIFPNNAIRFTKYKGIAMILSAGRDCEVRECFVIAGSTTTESSND